MLGTVTHPIPALAPISLPTRARAHICSRWITSLSSYFTRAGLSVAADEHQYRDPSHLAFYSDVAFMVWEEWRAKMGNGDQETYGEILSEARREMEGNERSGSINMEIRSVVGWKR